MKNKKLNKILAVESILTELMQRGGWSSRVQAERIYKVMTNKKARKKVKKPWEHFAMGLPEA